MTTQRWQVADYRSRRHLLDPDVFLNGWNPPPTDIIEPEVWDYLMHLADHVSITTSNHHGALLRRLFDLERVWVDAIAERPSFLDVMDDFTASMFLLLHGYYRQSIAALRSVLETTAIGVYLELLNDKVEFERWRRGIKEIGFGHAADRLRALPVVSAFEMRLRAAAQDDLFAQRSPDSEGGWSRRLYGRLCEYTHSRPGRTNSDLWRSNGPIYVRRKVNLVGSLYSETFTLSMLLLRFARPGQTGPRGFERNRSAWAKLARTCYSCL